MRRGIGWVITVLVVAGSASSALAEDETVVRRLTKHGQIGRGQAQSLAKDISKRMKRAADITSDDDPLRMAVSRALYGAPTTKDPMAAAKIRLRLYAGLNEWALDNLFAPRPGALARCQQEIGVSSRQCDALVAASGRVSVEEASKLGGGAANAGAPMMAAAKPQPANGRFARYDSGYRGGAQPAAAQRPMPATAARPMPATAARPMPAAAAPVGAADRRAEYQRQRQAYLDRKKAEMEARKAKLTANVAGAPVQRGPGSAEEAEVAGIAPSEATPAAAPAPQAKAAKGAKAEPAAAPEPAAEAAPAAEAPSGSPALDGDLLDSLLADPLGK